MSGKELAEIHLSKGNNFRTKRAGLPHIWRDCFFPWHWLGASENTAKMAVPLA